MSTADRQVFAGSAAEAGPSGVPGTAAGRPYLPTPCPGRPPATAAARYGLAPLLWVVALLAPPPLGAQESGGQALLLSLPVQQAFAELQRQWLAWQRAFHERESDRARAALDRLVTVAGGLGMSALPDLGPGAAASALEAAREGDFARAGWALDAAEVLDPERPGTAFARAAVARLEGRYLAAMAQHLEGHVRAVRHSEQRPVVVAAALVWGVGVLLAAAAVYVALQMVIKGPRLVRFLRGKLGRYLAPPAASLLALFLLLWPLLLPGGAVWLLLYWSVVVWACQSASERAVMVGLWGVLALAPLALERQAQVVTMASSPPMRAVDSCVRGRLTGTLLVDLSQLRDALPASTAVQQFLADVHRHFGQWEFARSLYLEVLDAEPENLDALLGLGAFYYRSGDYLNAAQHFRRAAVVAPDSAASYFNLSQAYSQSYLFAQSEEALSQARLLDPAAVARWVREPPSERVVTPDGGFRRRHEIRHLLVERWRRGAEPRGPWRTLLDAPSMRLALSCLAAALGLALLWWMSGAELPEPSPASPSRPPWKALLPGLLPAEEGRGSAAFGGPLVLLAFASLPLAGRTGYHVSWGLDPGDLLLWGVALVGVATYLTLHLRQALRRVEGH